jgi:adenosylcobinamide-GDP ribazoletransferase
VKATPFWLAVQFLTRLPTPVLRDVSGHQWGQSVLAYPVVGLIIGALLYCIATLSHGVDTRVLAGLLLSAWVLITGGLHLDGLADCVDAWIGGQGSRERSLAIMKDAYTGPMGVISLVLLLLLKYAGIATLLSQQFFVVLALAPVVGRTMVLALMLTVPYVRAGGIGEQPVRFLPRQYAVYLVAAVGLVVFFTLGLFVVLTTLVVFAILRSAMLKRLGGATGDTYGASVEIHETLVLLTAG